MKRQTKRTTEILYDIETTTSLGPHRSENERFTNLSDATARRKDLKKRYNYVSMTKVTVIREELHAAGDP